MRPLSFSAVACTSLFVALGCGGGYSGAPVGNPGPQYANVTGAWQATARSNTPGLNPVFVETNLTESGGTVTSTATAVINSCVGSGTGAVLSGTVTSTTISLSSTFQGVTVNLTGTISGSSISGTYTATGACPDTGTWSATKMPLLSGTYKGNLFSNSNPSQAIPATAMISTNASFTISGSASVSSVCFNQFTLSGTQVGGAGEITAMDAQGDSVTFLFVSQDAAFGTIAGTYSVTAGPSSCNGDAGTGSLLKQ